MLRQFVGICVLGAIVSACGGPQIVPTGNPPVTSSTRSRPPGKSIIRVTQPTSPSVTPLCSSPNPAVCQKQVH